MWVVLASVLAARRKQAVIVAVVALLATAALAAAPWYAVRASQDVGIAAVEDAGAQQRLITISWRGGFNTDPDADGEAAIRQAREQFKPTGFTAIVSATTTFDLWQPGAKKSSADVVAAAREDVCQHLELIDGSCPKAKGEVTVPATLADDLGLDVGDQMQLEDNDENRIPVRVAGVYDVSDPSEPYWGDGSLVERGESSSNDRLVMFTAPETLRGLNGVTHTYDLLPGAKAFATIDIDELSETLSSAVAELREQGFAASTTEFQFVIDRITQDRRNVATGVGVGVVVLLLLTWFALSVVVRGGGVQVRVDIGWWRLRGAPSGRGWILALGQSIVPLVAGAVLGAGIGLGVGRLLVGDLPSDAGRSALLLALLLVALTLTGGLLAVVAAQLSTLVTPVRDLLRRIPVRRPGWRRSLVDLVLVGLATYGVVQSLVVREGVGGLSALSPVLAGLAVALVTAWGVPPLATWLASRARHSGRLRTTLIASLTARRPETHRMFALVVVGVALVTTAFVGWDTGNRTRWERAALEMGADRVVTVDVDDPARLREVVRSVDPEGTRAMAVIDQPGSTFDPPILAVDSTRLSVVAGWRDGYGGSVERVAAALRPTDVTSVQAKADRLALEAAATNATGDVYLRFHLRTVVDAKPVDAIVGPLGTSRQSYGADLAACANGCRLVGVQILGPKRADASSGNAADAESVGHLPAPPGTQVELLPASESEQPLLPPALVADPTRWRPALGPRELGPAITAGTQKSLRVTMAAVPRGKEVDLSGWAYVADTPAPLPVVAAGWQPDTTAELRVHPLPGAAVPAAIVGNAKLIPRYGAEGVLVDLTYADRLVPFPLQSGVTPQVWLSADAPPSIVDELAKAGLRPLRTESLSERLYQLRSEGTAVTERFQLLVALVGLLLAAGAVLVDAARDQTVRAAEFAALRAQGVKLWDVRAVGYGGVAALVAAGAVVGVGAGLAGAAIARRLSLGFIDGWTVLPPAAMQTSPVLVATVTTTVVLGAVVVVAGAALLRRTRELS